MVRPCDRIGLVHTVASSTLENNSAFTKLHHKIIWEGGINSHNGYGPCVWPKEKVKFTVEQAMKAQRGSSGTALFFL
jgi:hypothetical protein